MGVLEEGLKKIRPILAELERNQVRDLLADSGYDDVPDHEVAEELIDNFEEFELYELDEVTALVTSVRLAMMHGEN